MEKCGLNVMADLDSDDQDNKAYQKGNHDH